MNVEQSDYEYGISFIRNCVSEMKKAVMSRCVGISESFVVEKVFDAAIARALEQPRDNGPCHQCGDAGMVDYDAEGFAIGMVPCPRCKPQQPEPESHAITALKVTLFGVECYLPSSVARSVESACKQQAEARAVAWMVEFKDGAVSFLREETPASMFDAMEAKVTPLYTTPPAKVPDGCVLVPVEAVNTRAAWLLDNMAWRCHPDSMSHDDACSLWVWAQDVAGLLRELAAAQQPKEGA